MATVNRISILQDAKTSVPSEWFVARITTVGSSASGSGACTGYPHAWIEQQICSNGYDYEDMPTSSARSGTTTVSPAFAIDGTQSIVNAIVLMRERTMDSSGQTVFEFIKTTQTLTPVSQAVVTDVTCSGGTLVVTKKTLTIPGGTVI